MTTTQLEVAHVLAAQHLEASGAVTMTIRRIPAHISPPTTEQGRTEPAQSEYGRWSASLPENYTDHAQWQLSAPELSRSGVMPYLAIDGAAAAITFYKKAFGATELIRIPAPGSKVGYAEMEIYGSRIMLADEYPDMGFRCPKAYGGTPMTLYLYVADVDAVARQAVAAGANELRPVQSSISTGDRTGTFEDPFGHVWCIATRKEVLSVDELKWRAKQNVKKHGVAGLSMNVRCR
jgi:PhnB protein